MDKQNDIIAACAPYSGIIFDLDGTLVDLRVDWSAVKESLRAHCLHEKGVDIEFTPLNQKMQGVKQTFGDPFFLELVAIVAGFELCEEHYRYNDALIAFLESCQEKKIAIYSMNTERCVEHFVHKHLKRKPDIVVTKESCSEPKPTDKDLKKIMHAWGMTARDVVYIGNTDDDRLSGERAGVSTYITHHFAS